MPIFHIIIYDGTSKLVIYILITLQPRHFVFRCGLFSSFFFWEFHSFIFISHSLYHFPILHRHFNWSNRWLKLSRSIHEKVLARLKYVYSCKLYVILLLMIFPLIAHKVKSGHYQNTHQLNDDTHHIRIYSLLWFE